VAQHVTSVQTTGPNLNRRRFLRALAARLGDGDQIRTVTLRDEEAARDRIAAAGPRLGIASVGTHVCRHDEGIGACVATEVVA
jgi:hypothetical protein